MIFDEEPKPESRSHPSANVQCDNCNVKWYHDHSNSDTPRCWVCGRFSTHPRHKYVGTISKGQMMAMGPAMAQYYQYFLDLMNGASSSDEP